MNREREIFFEALERSSPEDRLALLNSACGPDIGLRGRVEELLRAHDAAGNFLRGDRTRAASKAGPGPGEGPGTIVGRYKLLEKIGEGGFGVVYSAEQCAPVKRTVALKIIKLGMDTTDVVARFEAERQALALMEHPNIARVLDAGATEAPIHSASAECLAGVAPGGPAATGNQSPTILAAGRPYFVMELVRGVPITRFCDENRLTIEERLRLFVQVCSAIQHAHQKGVIHRDIKPGNVLITMQDDRVVPKVIDFGIAKAIGQDLADRTVLTRAYEFLGTPTYMSPEQTQLRGLDIDTRSDIYSLGVLLYELLTGRTPFDAGQLLDGGFETLRRRICDEEPPKPSARLMVLPEGDRAAMARHCRSEPHQHRRKLAGDLDWIVVKALEKDRARRYESAAAFAHDVERYLADETVLAAAPGMGYRFRKFARRHRKALATAAALLSVLVVATLVSSWLAIRASFAERTARSLLENEQRSRQHLVRTLVELKRARQEEETLRQRADLEATRARTEAATADAVARFLNEDVFSSADPENEPGRELTLRAVLDRASLQLDSSLTNEPLVAASIHRTIGRAYRNLALPAPAIEHLRRAHELYVAELGERDPQSIRALSDYADAVERTPAITEAVALARKAYALASVHLGPAHSLTIKCGSRWAWALCRNKSRDQAFELIEELYATACGAAGVEPPDMLSIMTLVAFHRGSSKNGDYAAGEEILKQALKFIEERYGSNHLQTVRAKANLGVYYFDRAMQPAECERLFDEVLEALRRSLGESHQRTLVARGNVALANERAGRATATQYHYLKILEQDPLSRRPLEMLPGLFRQAPLKAVINADSPAWRMTSHDPGTRWERPGFADSRWIPPGPNVSTEGWWRHSLELRAVPAEPFVVTVRGWGDFEVFVNGTPAVKSFGSTGRMQLGVIHAAAMNTLRAGHNVVAVRGANLRPKESVRIEVREFPAAPVRTLRENADHPAQGT